MQVSKIDILVYPAWAGGCVHFESGVIPSTGTKVTYNRWASTAKRNMWLKYAKEISNDESRLLFVIHERNGHLEKYLWDENDWAGKQLGVARYALTNFKERCFLVEDVDAGFSWISKKDEAKEKKILAKMVSERGYLISDPVENSVYGHHRGDCTLKVGKKVLESLGLEKTKLKENIFASVMDQEDLICRTIEKHNPDLYRALTIYEDLDTSKCSPEICDRRHYLRMLIDYLFLTKTPLQIKHFIKKVSGIDELVERLNPRFHDMSGEEMVKLNVALSVSKLKSQAL